VEIRDVRPDEYDAAGEVVWAAYSEYAEPDSQGWIEYGQTLRDVAGPGGAHRGPYHSPHPAPGKERWGPLGTEPGGCNHLAGHRPATPPGLRQRERANAAVGRGRVQYSARHGGGAPDVGSDLAGLPKLPPVTGTRRIPPLGTQGPLRT